MTPMIRSKSSPIMVLILLSQSRGRALGKILPHLLVLLTGDLTACISRLEDLGSDRFPPGRGPGAPRSPNHQEGQAGDQSHPEDQAQEGSDQTPQAKGPQEPPVAAAERTEFFDHRSPLFWCEIRAVGPRSRCGWRIPHFWCPSIALSGPGLPSTAASGYPCTSLACSHHRS